MQEANRILRELVRQTVPVSLNILSNKSPLHNAQEIFFLSDV